MASVEYGIFRADSFTLAWPLLEQGGWEEALEVFRKAFADDPERWL